ncbi:MAG: 23S rRNA (adenine(2503)-C(2))-methyltransferase RlmN [Holosporaceae bacterium]|jgi:23S rRNA (adenine2503-C2)-methyltransferase|nr:23S rRNA (adenine(2503)-C(2))-methyltransferase RlmN [Holosporaceae bacterium]
MQSLLGLTLEQIKSEFVCHGFTVLDAKRVFPWIHSKRVESFDVMSDLPCNVREALKSTFSLDRPFCKSMQKSLDGTQKALLELEDGNSIETVLITSDKRTTVCLSSQVGCSIGCKFCRTGTQSSVRNLSSSEIMSQYFFWNNSLITNVVFMGMGEPLLNYENVATTLELLLNKKIYNFSRNKITISTSGIIEDSIYDLAKFGVKLAISLHAPDNEKRSSLMPINKKYDIETLIKTAEKYRINSNTSHVTFEYLLLKDVNDSDADAFKLAKLLKGICCKVNLISFNQWYGSNFAESSPTRTKQFLHILLSNKIFATIRKSNGSDILAACGQLKTECELPFLSEKSQNI